MRLYSEVSLHTRINNRGIMGNIPFNPKLLTKQERGDIKHLIRRLNLKLSS